MSVHQKKSFLLRQKLHQKNQGGRVTYTKWRASWQKLGHLTNKIPLSNGVRTKKRGPTVSGKPIEDFFKEFTQKQKGKLKDRTRVISFNGSKIVRTMHVRLYNENKNFLVLLIPHVWRTTCIIWNYTILHVLASAPPSAFHEVLPDVIGSRR